MKEFKENFNLKDGRVHLEALGLVVVAELIGKLSFSFFNGKLSFSLFPMLFATAIGMILGGLKKFPKEDMEQASPYISIAVMLLLIKLNVSIGQNWDLIKKGGLALVAQEFGNLGTCLFAMPVAIFCFKMGRAAIGASFSISREPSIAVISEKYGLEGPEGAGVLGGYVTGTVLGTLFYAIIPSLIAATGIFHPYSLGMAAGTGSASMMSAAMAAVVDLYPEMEEGIKTYATASNALSNADGVYMSVLIAIPWCEHMYKLFTKKQEAKKVTGK